MPRPYHKGLWLQLDPSGLKVVGIYRTLKEAAEGMGVNVTRLYQMRIDRRSYMMDGRQLIPDDGRPLYGRCPNCKQWRNLRELRDGKCQTCILWKIKPSTPSS